MIAANHVVVLLHRRHAEVLPVVLVRRRGGIAEIGDRIEAVLKRDGRRIQTVGGNAVARERLARESGRAQESSVRRNRRSATPSAGRSG